MLEPSLEKISHYITSNNIALLSVIITVLLYIFTRHSEIRYKKYEDKKIQYLKLIELMQKTLACSKIDKSGDSILSDEIRKLFFDTGASLLLYGSKKIYRQYLLFREFSTNSLIKHCKYYKSDIVLFIVADIFKTMRKEAVLAILTVLEVMKHLHFLSMIYQVTLSLKKKLLMLCSESRW